MILMIRVIPVIMINNNNNNNNNINTQFVNEWDGTGISLWE